MANVTAAESAMELVVSASSDGQETTAVFPRVPLAVPNVETARFPEFASARSLSMVQLVNSSNARTVAPVTDAAIIRR